MTIAETNTRPKCLGCVRLEDDAQCVTLIDGTVVCTWCPAWLLECEARELLRWPLQKRRDFLANAEKQRGKVAIEELKAKMIELHEKGK